MKKILTGVLCGLFLFSVLNAVASGAAPRKVRAKPKLRPRRVIVTPRPLIIREPVIIRQPLPTYTEKTSLGGPVIGLSAGWFGGIPSAAAEIWFQNIFDTSKLNLRSGVRYAQGEDPDKAVRKNALVFTDGILFLYDGTRFKTYLGGGINYLAYTTGKKSGSVGAELYLGMEAGSWHSGSFYAEAGYGDIRTGFSPSIKGLTLDIGYKTGM